MSDARTSDLDDARRLAGSDVSVATLDADPYPVYAALRARGRLVWVRSLNMWYATHYEDVRAILLDSERFTTDSPHSTIRDTFGAQMLSAEGAPHARYRRATQPAFMTSHIRDRLEAAIARAADALVDAFAGAGESELRASFASRLPIQVMLRVFGLPGESEPRLRSWYDSFERALANFTGDPAVRAEGKRDVADFHAFLDDEIARSPIADRQGLLHDLVGAAPAGRLSDGEIKRNMAIIFFGGISTVEALMLNSLWALFRHRAAFDRVRGDGALLPAAIEETMRWLSPVQSATRHVAADTDYAGIRLRAGETVNCMLGAANRDPAVFADPDRFDIERANANRHLGFATGPHLCLGFRLAKAEVRIALETLLRRLPELALDERRDATPRGYEFRQPRALHVRWRPSAAADPGKVEQGATTDD
jgi:cytochrome P450